ncbi:F-box-like protein [Cinnamomum micranthum f. kanehirae]|uniref:F-box-like protein n=1 Tax=Cinnamomum micranthum f. kanehirae TaxID=337451 RepID=A0A443PYD0_9MAGN|nr:F-box-like protein [Cinnamomum micranthum f. kanehirae]
MADPPPDDPLHQHKLCGFFRIVLSPKPPQPKTLSPGARCSLFSDGSEICFRTEDGILLSPPVANAASGVDREEPSGHDAVVSTPDSGQIKAFSSECGGGGSSASSSRRRKRRIGTVYKCDSAVHQLHSLRGHRCLEFVASVVRVLVRDGEARAVVLVDVYLPLAVWSGWQFPKSPTMAASLFQHMSCNWEERNSLLSFNVNDKYTLGDNDMIWNNSDCHILGCKIHCNISVSAKRRLFDLHEIFKSLPAIGKGGKTYSTRINPASASVGSGIWDVSDDVLTNVLTALGPQDLVRVAATCRHLRSLAVPITPCVKLKLFPHQQAAVEWMLQRERNAGVLAHPLYMDFSTEDGFHFYINSISGEISTGIAPTIMDFRGGMFCDEPGLGKTITALSLILKTHGTLADPPQGAEVMWSTCNPERRCGYYELSAENFTNVNFMSSWKRFMGQSGRRGQADPDKSSPDLSSTVNSNSTPLSKRVRLMCSEVSPWQTDLSSCFKRPRSSSAKSALRDAKRTSHVKRNLLDSYEGSKSLGKRMNNAKVVSEVNETWVQCDACSKWRKLPERVIPDITAAWFCNMNSDPFHQSCAIPQESWDYNRCVTHLPGFYTKGTPQGKEQNISFFTSMLKEHCTLLNSETKKALTWLANLSHEKLVEMETIGLRRPVADTRLTSTVDVHGFHKIFQAFGLIRRVRKGTTRWHYPDNLDNLSLDLAALRVALTKRLDLFRLYLSRATLIVVPANLVNHWETQIRKHVSPGRICIFVWTDKKKPSAHNLAWDYDIVITTFNRLSAEWGPRRRSVLMQVHWLRVMLDEGHTLGSSLSLTNKLQMAVSLAASNRWLLTGTPTPNTPVSQVANLHPMLKFLHEEAYGQNQKSWEAGILRPFEMQMEEGQLRLLQLLQRCMISARKEDLQMIPPCIKKATLLDFTEEHAKSYNELVVTVRRNILMADWNDPSHVESLLNPKQWKFRSNTIRNVRLSCCVAGHIKVSDAGHDIQETMDILVEQGLDPVSEEYVFIQYSLLNGGSCFRCKEWCRLPVITPCRHLLCLDCVALDSEKCTLPGCGSYYEMQSPEILTRPENPNPQWPVPKDLIELQPSYKQDDWDPDWHATSSSKVTYLVEKLKALQEANRKMGYCADEVDGAIPFGDVLVSSQNRQWNMLLKSNIKIGSNDDCHRTLPEKVIIFSQFLEHIHVIEQQLTIAGIKYAGMYSPMHSSNKMKSLMIFQYDANCMVLLMDGSAALGLDLSFVTHVFLMEPIWDRSMEEQVISRAHRMGATRPVHVETLAMRGTIEEQMLEFLQVWIILILCCCLPGTLNVDIPEVDLGPL